MRYIPHTPEEITSMLKTIGVGSVDDLFKGIPEELRFRDRLPLPEALSEHELREDLKGLSDLNINLTEGVNFIGAGAYYHYVPSVIAALAKRGEFLTAYTPYQPEVSQGTLQAVYEFQTMICELTGMEVANSSNYDLSTSVAEAIMMAQRVNGKNRVLIARSLHPHYREVVKTYFKNQDLDLMEIPFNKHGSIDLDFVRDNLDDSVCAVVVQSPNFFGVIEDLKSVGVMTKEFPALFVAATAESMSYAVLASPGECGADIAIGEGMSFGLGTNFGGPYLGLFATKQEYIRSMPGRLVGRTTDKDGKLGYVLTMATREQHIRREKATSNICTNQGLCALMSSMYLSLMGPVGLQKIAMLNMKRLQDLEAQLNMRSKTAVCFSGPKFNETVVELKLPAKDAVIHLLKDKIFAGVDLSTYYPELNRHLLVCTTEMVSGLDVQVLAERLSQFF